MSTIDPRPMTLLPTDTVSQARQAIGHVLRQIRDRSEVGYYLGYATQSFERLTEAYALLTNENLEAVQEAFAPRKACNPRKIVVDFPGQLYADIVKPAGRRWSDMDEFYKDEAVRAERNLLAEYGIEIEASEGGDE